MGNPIYGYDISKNCPGSGNTGQPLDPSLLMYLILAMLMQSFMPAGQRAPVLNPDQLNECIINIFKDTLSQYLGQTLINFSGKLPDATSPLPSEAAEHMTDAGIDTPVYKEDNPIDTAALDQSSDKKSGLTDDTALNRTADTEDSPMDNSGTVPDAADSSQAESFTDQPQALNKIAAEPLPADSSSPGRPLPDYTVPVSPPRVIPRNMPEKVIDIHPEVVETNSFVIIKIKVPDGLCESDFKISLHETYVSIQWKAGYVEQIIPLPSDIVRQQATAAMKNHTIEIKIPRESGDGYRKVQVYTY